MKEILKSAFDAGAEYQKQFESKLSESYDKPNFEEWFNNKPPISFTLKQENAIWGVIQYLSNEQYKNPKKVFKREDVFKLI